MYGPENSIQPCLQYWSLSLPNCILIPCRMTQRRPSEQPASFLDGESFHDLCSGALNELLAVAKFLQLPLENVGQFRFSVHAEFVLIVVANRPRRQPLENYFDLMHGPRIRTLLGDRRKSA